MMKLKGHADNVKALILNKDGTQVQIHIILNVRKVKYVCAQGVLFLSSYILDAYFSIHTSYRSSKVFHMLLLETGAENLPQGQNLAINKKSTIVVQSL